MRGADLGRGLGAATSSRRRLVASGMCAILDWAFTGASASSHAPALLRPQRVLGHVRRALTSAGAAAMPAAAAVAVARVLGPGLLLVAQPGP